MQSFVLLDLGVTTLVTMFAAVVLAFAIEHLQNKNRSSLGISDGLRRARAKRFVRVWRREPRNH